jgi:predicted alpha-1,2-mannosidase
MLRATFFLSVLSCPGWAQVTVDPAAHVNPFIGTGNGAPDAAIGNSAGDTPPGAAFPFGMILWSPDTTTLAGGYRYHHNRINGFSLTHYSGRGISCYQDVPIMPINGSIRKSPGTNWADYAAGFSHDDESASPGSYGVSLDSGVRVDLSVTTRTGIGRFTFPGEVGTFLVNAGGSANGNHGDGTLAAVVGPSSVVGSAVSGDCGGYFTYRGFFVIDFDLPFDDFGTWNGDKVSPNAVLSRGGTSGAWVSFRTSGAPTVHARMALSFTSVDNAWKNLRAENPGWSLDETAAAARAAWNTRLGAIRVTGGTPDQRTVFYTALDHSFIHPSTFSDSNGDYLGFDNTVHNAGTRTHYHNFASWDIYRAQMPLLAMLAPEANDMMQSLVNDAAQDPSGGLPRWQHANTNSGGMIGDGPAAVIATVYAFGARDFDAAAALDAMERGASRLGTTSGGQLVRPALADYLKLGYVSTNFWGSASRTLEYAISDFSISQLARALGDSEPHRRYLQRSRNWHNLVHDTYVVPRRTDGTFLGDFDPGTMDGFVESSAAQWFWSVPFDLGGLIAAAGGNAAAIARLDRHFTLLNDGPGSEYAFLGNEPELKTPWIYAFAGAPWRSQEVVRRALLSLFHNTPGGMPGNDDGGAISAWAVFAATGIFPPIPAVGGFVVDSPLFPHVSLRLANGNSIEIEAPGAAAEAPFVQRLGLNGSGYGSSWIPWDAVMGGASLELALAGSPNVNWASDPTSAPPSYGAPEERGK